MITVAQVKIWGVKVGIVKWNYDFGYSTFEYDKDFWRQGLQLSPIKLKLRTNANENIFSFMDLRRSTTFKGLPGLLADSLPDRYGNEVINAWLQSQGREEYSLNPVETLCFIGKRGMGALEFFPENPKADNKVSKIEIGNLIEIAGEILSERKSFKSKFSPSNKSAMLDILKIGTTAGGAQAKAIIAFNPKTKEIRSGQTDAPTGFSHWIIKFDGIKINNEKPKLGRGRIEYAYYKMAKKCGIEMTECRLLEENGRAHFMTKRFDRDGNEKIHMQTLSALRHVDFDLSNSYEDIFQTLRFLQLPYYDFEQLYRRMVFNVMAINYDDHAKNFSFLMDKDSRWKLSPAYDLTYMYNEGLFGPIRASSVNGKRNNITKLDLWDVARRNNIKKADEIVNEISDVVSHWMDYAENEKVNPILRDAINNNLVIM